MTKKNKTTFSVFTEAIGLYCSNIIQFIKYMSFPVLGQVLGLFLIFRFTGIYSNNISKLADKYQIFNDLNILILGAIIITLPGMIIFLKAFWEYLVAYGSVNSMLDNMLKSGKVYDFSAHTEVIKRRTADFVGLWLLAGLFSLVAVIPFFWVPAGVIAVYFVLIFQVFTYEAELSPIECVKKSFNLIKGNFLQTFILMIAVGILTYIILPKLGVVISEKIRLTKLLAIQTTSLVSFLPVNDINELFITLNIPKLQVDTVASFIVTTTIGQIIFQYTLPMRVILWGLWYKKLSGEKCLNKTNLSRRKSKRPSEKLMEESNKKYSSEKLDRNILKRAMEKDED